MCSIESIESDLRCTVEEIASVAFERLSGQAQAQVYATVRYGFSLPTERLSHFGVLFGKTVHILSKHTHSHKYVCVCMSLAIASLVSRFSFLVSLSFFGFSQLLRFFELPIRAKTHTHIGANASVCVNCNCEMDMGLVLRSRCSSR